MKKVCFIAKTDLNKDGRILNEIRILKEYFGADIFVDFVLLPDKPFLLDFKFIDHLHEINISSRNKPALRWLTVVEFVKKTIKILRKIKPDIIHAEDSAIVLPVILYKKYYDKNVRVIYDDHEMPNENEGLQYKFMQYFEKLLMKRSELVIYANKERKEILDSSIAVKKSIYFLNLPYFEKEATLKVEEAYSKLLNQLLDLKSKGYRLIIHQGSLDKERGREKLAAFSAINLKNTKIVIVGVSRSVYQSFIQEFSLNEQNFFFVGSVPYTVLGEFWKLMDATVIMYLPTFINNRYCAPNRYFIALKYGIPTIVNEDNPVLYNFTKEYNSGVFIEHINTDDDLGPLFDTTVPNSALQTLKITEIDKLENIYKKIMEK